MTFAIKEEGGMGANAIRFFLNNLLKKTNKINPWLTNLTCD